ncbi:hypothetical protein RA307_05540 [Xanthobacteraceae bacterium Astr-EGSB]|uniref:hypothetical protein n=1 Tax=Astrobacterium formosum TaxID=3069710 RepID=UPI0027B7D558|nr:hypothetical protein [Xanthobacteraceae bacterium Astr-EGSB]
MEAYAKLLTAVAAIVGAVAWPAVFVATVLVFRNDIRAAFKKAQILLDRVNKVKWADIAVELDRVADIEAESGPDKGGKITLRQIETAARIKIESQELDIQALLRELDRLCLEYDSIRRALPSGNVRTRAMTRVIVKMRSLAPSVADYLDAYKGSGSPGSRLAAIAIMQMVPAVADVEWLRERFSSEQPFAFYHASLALQNVANITNGPEQKHRLRSAAQDALARIKGFAGVPDQETVEVLESLISSLRE